MAERSKGRRERLAGLLLIGVGLILVVGTVYLWLLLESLSHLGSGAEQAFSDAAPGYLLAVLLGLLVAAVGVWLHRRNRN